MLQGKKAMAPGKIDPTYFLTTRRLGFRTWAEQDFDLALGLWGDEKVTRRIDARGKLSESMVKERLTKEIATQETFGVQYWPIFLLKTDAPIGCCGLRPYDLSKRVYEIGFHIRSAHWRKGYAFEAAGAVIEYGFNKIKAAALFAGHHPENEISRNLLEKLGFRYTHTEFYPPTGLHHPSYLLSPEDRRRVSLPSRRKTSGSPIKGARPRFIKFQ